MKNSNERVAYFNGKIVPESEVMIPFRDRSFKYGDGVFDMTRTFGHKIFKLEEHIDRFYDSLSYVKIDPGINKNEMIDQTMNVLNANLPLIDKMMTIGLVKEYQGGLILLEEICGIQMEVQI